MPETVLDQAAPNAIAPAGDADRFRAGQTDTVLHALERAVASSGDKIFLDVGGDTVTYREIDQRATRIAHEFSALGIAKGDTVVSIMDNSVDVIAIWFAINKLGAIWVPINTAYEHEFLRHQIMDAGASLVLCDLVYLERVVVLADQLPTVKRILCRDDGPFPDCPTTIEPFDRYRGTNDTPIPIAVKPGDLACLLYTSGTTGPSKGCMISHNYMAMQGRQQRRAVHEADDEWGWTLSDSLSRIHSEISSKTTLSRKGTRQPQLAKISSGMTS